MIVPMQASWGELSVGDPVRTAVGRAVVASMGLATLFTAFTWLAKELPPLYVHEPWQDDPYDALVSFDLIAVSILLVAGAARVVLCRRNEPLPARRGVDLLRICQVMLLLVGVTLASEWVSVVSRTDRATWNLVTVVVGSVALALTGMAVRAELLLSHARQAIDARGIAPQQPDWLADAVAFGEFGAARLGPARSMLVTAVRWADRAVVTRVRRHPLAWAGGVSLLVALVADTPQIIIERYSPVLAAYVYAVSAASLYAFFVLAGTYLCVVARPTARSSPWVVAGVAACVGGVLGVSFRTSLWWLVGTTDAESTLPQLIALTVVTAVISGSTTLLVATIRRRVHRAT